MKKILFLFCMILTTLSQAKKWDATYIAKLIGSGEIDKVIQYYQERYYGANRDPQDAFKLAEIYVKKKDYATAMQWYTKEQQLINTSKVNLFNYANTCRLMGDYQKALDAYLMYAAQTGDVNKVMDLANQCERVLKASAQQGNFKLENYTYNTPADETNVSVLRTNPVYITIQQPASNDDKPSYSIHQVVRDFQNFAEPVDVLHGDIPKFTITSLSYTRDGNKVVFSAKETTASAKKKSAKDIEKIYMADNLGGNFLNIKPFQFNSDTYSSKDPTYNSEGTVLYFSSDQPGGYGGFDIWESFLVNGKWSKPVSLGKLLNTNYNEIMPYLVQDNKDNSLYFSSDREGGFGGYDIYDSKNIDHVWQDVEIQPAPINSNADDISMIYDSEIKSGYFSSDRSGGKGGFDVYRFIPFNLRLIIHTNDPTTNKPIDYALVQVTENGANINEGVTNENGTAVFQIGRDKSFAVTISKDNYKPVSMNINSSGKMSGDSMEVTQLLKQSAQFSIVNGATNNLSMDNYITFTGKVIDASTNKPARNTKMRMVNYSTKKLREIEIDQDGRFRIRLLLNNSYKVIFETQENKSTDELTTYGLDKFDVKLRDYLLSGSKIKLLDNKVYKEDNMPPEIKIDTKHNTTTAPRSNNSGNVPVTQKKIDSLMRVISENKTLPESKPLSGIPNASEPVSVKKSNSQRTDEIKGDLTIIEKQTGNPLTTKENIINNEVKDANTIVNNQPKKEKDIVAGQDTLKLKTDNISPSQPTAIHPEIYYKIQLGSYPEGNLSFPEFDPIGKVEITQSFGQFIYRLGDMYNLEEARKTLDKIKAAGYYAAFILKFNKNKVTAIVN